MVIRERNIEAAEPRIPLLNAPFPLARSPAPRLDLPRRIVTILILRPETHQQSAQHRSQEPDQDRNRQDIVRP